MTLRSLVIALLFSASVVGGVIALTLTNRRAYDSIETSRVEAGVQLAAGVTGAQASAFVSSPAPVGVGPTVTHPPAGAIYPRSFPPPRIQWSDDYASRTYDVQVKAGSDVLFHAVTTAREVRPAKADWAAVQAATGPVSIVVRGAVVAPDGAITGDVGESEVSSFVVAPAADDPAGLILFGHKLRPPGKEVGDVPLLSMQLRIDALDLEKMDHRVVFRSSYGPEPTRFNPIRAAEEAHGPHGPAPGGPGLPPPPMGQDPSQIAPHGPPPARGSDPRRDERNDANPHDGRGGGGDDELTSTQCVSCHAASTDGHYIATFSQAAEEAPPTFDAPNGFLTVLEMPTRKVLWQLPHAFMPTFNPVHSNLLAFGKVDETIGIKDQQMVRKSDIQVLDIATGSVKSVPGASTPDRVENFPYWSPDGELIAFIRTQPGQIWHGAQGLIDIAVVPYAGGAGGTAVPVPGASQNGKSNVLPVYSPDGRWLVFTQTTKGFFSQQSADLYIVSSEGGEARRMDCNSTHAESWHRFSPDGKWLAVVTNREDIKRPHIYLARFDTTTGTCTPAVQIPIVSGPGAHTHAFSWTPRYDWIADYELVAHID